VMTKDPKTARPDTLVATALQTINNSAITSLMVVEGRLPVGLVHLHDLLRIGAA
jgi:arabinose-5-phosphate isomerase